MLSKTPLKRKLEGLPADSRAEILQAGLRLFAQRGFDGVSTRDIAKAVGIKQASLYYHYKRKEDIYFEVAKLAVAIVSQKILDALRVEATAEERIRRFFRVSISNFDTSTESEARILDLESTELRKCQNLFSGGPTRDIHAELAGAIKEINPDCPADQLAYYFMSITHGARQQRGIQQHLPNMGGLMEMPVLCDTFAEWALQAVRHDSKGRKFVQQC